MAKIGQIIYLYGPFANSNNNIIPDSNPDTGQSNMNCKIGISIDEKDCMQWQNAELVPDENYTRQYPPKKIQPIIVNISGNEIQIGRTFIYQPDGIVDKASLSFPYGAPASTKVCIIYS